MKKIIIRILLFIVAIAVILGVFWLWPRLPILTSISAKLMCSSLFMADRSPEEVHAQSFFPVTLAKTKVNYEDQSVTASLLGLARRKAVYREGLGATPVADADEDSIRAQAVTDIPRLQSDPDTIDWPLGNRYRDTLFPEINYPLLDTAINRVFDPEGAEPSLKTLAVMVIYKNLPVRERYAGDITPDTKLIGWSMSKSITNAMVGILVGQGKLVLDAPAPVPEWTGDERKEITLNHLMHQVSGLEWVEAYFDLSDVTRMLYMKGDMYKYAIERPAASKPGEVWHYSSGNTNIISGIIRHCFNDIHEYHLFPHTSLFNRLGMRNTLLEADAAGTFTGSSYCFASVHDWARFGLLFLNKGVFAGDTILPPGWVDYSIQPAEGSNGDYGAQIWLNRGGKLPDCPGDIFYFRGFMGQMVYIIPSRSMIIIRLGYGEKMMDYNRFVSDILSAFNIHNNES